MDTWRLTPKFTLTYGLRYELFAPIMDRNNNTTNFTPANGGGMVTAASNASGWYARSLIHPDLNDFAPRLGFAYQMTDQLVWRGGYGVFYQHSNRIGSESLMQLNPPFLLDVQLNQSGANTVFQLQNGFPWTPSQSGTVRFDFASDTRPGSEPALQLRRTDQLRSGISAVAATPCSRPPTLGIGAAR